MNTLQKVLETVDGLLVVASSLPVIGPDASIAEALLRIVEKAQAAHQSLLGQPLDLSKLHDIDPIA